MTYTLRHTSGEKWPFAIYDGDKLVCIAPTEGYRVAQHYMERLMTEKTINKAAPFTYSDIKYGDHVRITDVHPNGSKYSVEGVAEYLYGTTWKTKDRLQLVSDRVSEGVTRTIELLDRPIMPVKIGTIISAQLKDSEDWVHLVRVEQVDEDDKLVWLELQGTGDDYHTEEEIKGWIEMKLVVA